MSSTPPNPPDPALLSSMTNPLAETPKQQLILLLRLIALVTFLAFGAAVMPEKWIREASEFLGFDPFPQSPLTYYLARHLSVLYGFVGVLLWIAANDFERYQPLVRRLAVLTIAFGVLQALVDAMSSLPWWWTLTESTSTVLGGILLWWMEQRVRQANAT